MNPIKQFYCRVFQVAFRAALPVLPYRNPVLRHDIAEVAAVFAQTGKHHPLIVTDTALHRLGLTQKLEDTLQQAGIPYTLYDGVAQNPTTRMVEEALAQYHTNGCDSLIAFGGGSPMDCAKAVGARVVYPNKPLGKMAGIIRVWKKLPPLIAIPTTAGTGSETTLAAVIVDAETRHKYVINSFPLIPAYAVLDASVIHSLPCSVAAATGMDALTHAVEAYIGRSTTKATRADAIQAVQLVFTHLEAAAHHTDTEAEAKMLLASHLAGRAFTRSYVGYVHAVSHSLSGQYDMPHGLTNAILLPIVLELYGPAAHKKLAQLALAVGLGQRGEPNDLLAERFIEAVYALNQRLGIPNHIDGIREEDIDKLAAYADKEANPLYPVPVLWDKEQLKVIYRKAGNHGR